MIVFTGLERRRPEGGILIKISQQELWNPDFPGQTEQTAQEKTSQGVAAGSDCDVQVPGEQRL